MSKSKKPYNVRVEHSLLEELQKIESGHRSNRLNELIAETKDDWSKKPLLKAYAVREPFIMVVNEKNQKLLQGYNVSAVVNYILDNYKL